MGAWITATPTGNTVDGDPEFTVSEAPVQVTRTMRRTKRALKREADILRFAMRHLEVSIDEANFYGNTAEAAEHTANLAAYTEARNELLAARDLIIAAGG
jgi:hypothetical protein